MSRVLKYYAVMVRLIAFIHMLVLGFVCTGCFWPWTTTLIIHAVFVPLMILHWRTNRNRCFLTELEERFRVPEDHLAAKAEAAVEAEEAQFVRSIWKKLFGRVPTENALNRLIYAVIGFVWVISVGRLTLRLAA